MTVAIKTSCGKDHSADKIPPADAIVYDPALWCRLCWREMKSKPQEAVKVGVCKHMGKTNGNRVLCPSCRGHVELKLFECAVFGECLPSKKVADIACCEDCQFREV